MPDVFFVLRDIASSAMTNHVFAELSRVVSLAIAETLPNIKVSHVSVYEITAKRAYNAPHLQIICMASKTEERLQSLQVLRDNIVKQVQALEEDSEVKAFLDLFGPAEAWAIMPEGSWANIPRA